MTLLLAQAGDPSSPWWLPLVGVLIGGVLTIVSTFAATWWSDRLKRSTERQQLAAAIGGELFGILSLVQHRQMTPILKKCFDVSSQSGKLQYLSFSISNNYFEVFEKNVDRIGSLPPPLAADVAEIYVYMKGAAEDLNTLHSGTVLGWDFNFGLAFLSNVILTLETTEKKGRALIPRLQQEALRTIWQELDGSG